MATTTKKVSEGRMLDFYSCGSCSTVVSNSSSVTQSRYRIHDRKKSRGFATPTTVFSFLEGRSSLDISTQGYDRYRRLSTPTGHKVKSRANQAGQSAETPEVRTVATQTLYRDEEAQTDPFSPAYVVLAGDDPELLTLALLFGKLKIPMGLLEFGVIEYMRNKKAVEASLPPASDLSQRKLRWKTIARLEMHEWSIRESRIQRLWRYEHRAHNALLELRKRMLKERDELREKLQISRLEKMWAGKQHEREAKVRKIRDKHLQALNKLTVARTRLQTIIQGRAGHPEKISTCPQCYGPSSFFPSKMDYNSELFVVRSKHLSTYQGLLELEESVPDFVLNPRVNSSGLTRRRQSLRIKRPCRHSLLFAEQAKEALNEKRLEAKRRDDEKVKQRQNVQLVLLLSQTVERPPTPQTTMLDKYPTNIEAQEKTENEIFSLIMIQKVIRGRAIQNKMFEGKERHRDLIRELKSTHTLHAGNESEHIKYLHHMDTKLQKEQERYFHTESLVDEGLADLESRSLAEMMDFLAKEMIRLEEEQRIQAFAMLCDRKRRMREAAEGRKRQEELQKRVVEETVFREILKVHKFSLDTYLEGVIVSSIDTVSDVQAKKEVEVKAEAINSIAYELQKGDDTLRSDEIVSDLVYSFLIPEANKATVREKDIDDSDEGGSQLKVSSIFI